MLYLFLGLIGLLNLGVLLVLVSALKDNDGVLAIGSVCVIIGSSFAGLGILIANGTLCVVGLTLLIASSISLAYRGK